MRPGIVVPIRSGITNSICWLLIELLIGFIIDRLLIICYNRLLVRSLSRGAYVEVRESQVCLFGNGLLAGHPLTCPIILFRVLIAVAFLFMNLGIDGLTLPLYKSVLLHSQVQVASQGTSCRNTSVHHLGWALAKCTRFDADRIHFNVTSPMFNLSKDATQDRYFVDAKSLRCMDGLETKHKKVLVYGRMIRSIQLRRSLHLNGHMYLRPENAPVTTAAGAIYKLSKVTAAKTKQQILNRGLLSAYCTPRRQLSVTDGTPGQLEHGSLCCFFYRLGNSTYVFKGLTVGLFKRARGIAAKISFSDGLIFDNGIDFSSEKILEILAKDLLERGEGLFGLLPFILDCHFDASIDRIEEPIQVAVGQFQATQVRLYSCLIAILVVLFAFILASLVLCSLIYRDRRTYNNNNNMDIVDDVQLNTIDGLSRLLANTSSRYPASSSNARARISYNNHIRVTTSEWHRIYQFPNDPPD